MSKQFRTNLMKTLARLGIKTSLKGYHYLRDAIIYVYKNGAQNVRIYEDVYRELASRYGVNQLHAVEHTIRHAIEGSVQRSDVVLFNEIFSYSIAEGDRPTNFHYISAVVEYLTVLEYEEA